MTAADVPERVGRYRIERRIGGGGMGEVYLGTAVGDGGFSRKVAIKRLRPDLAQRATFVSMLLDEARLASAIRSPHVVATLDVVQERGEFYVVMDYVEGHSLDTLVLASTHTMRVPPPIAAALVVGLLTGLRAAHAATDADGNPLHLVHRDVSPHNVLVGNDGVVRVIDFGVAKAKDRLQTTQTGEVKGKPTYMAPEQLLALEVDHRADLFSATVMFWEMLTGKRFKANERLLARDHDDVLAPAPSADSGDTTYDEVCARGLAMMPGDRYDDAAAMIAAIEAAGPVATAAEVKAWAGRALVGSVPAPWSSIEILVEHESFLERESEIAPRATATLSLPPAVQPPPMARSAPPPATKKRSVAPFVVLFVLSAALAGGAVVARGRLATTPDGIAPSSASSSSAEPVTPAAPVASSAASAPPPPVAVTMAHDEPTPSARVSGAPSARRKKPPPPPPTAKASVAAPPPPAASAPPKPDCREPFVVLADGTKVPRRECFP